MTAIIWLTILAQIAIDPNRFNGYLLLGYGVMWLVAIVYILTLVNRQRNVRHDLELLRRLLAEEEESGSAGVGEDSSDR